MFALPTPARRLLAGKPIRLDGQTLDLDVQLLLRLSELQGTDVRQARASSRAGRALAGGTERRSSPSRPRISGCPTAFRPGCTRPAELPAGSPLLVFFHGGGFAIGDIDSHDTLPVPGPQRRRPGAVGRLPAGAGGPVPGRGGRLPWRRSSGPSAEADVAGRGPEAIAVGGDSAGGNLAAVGTSGGLGRTPPGVPLLLYPTVDATVRRRSREIFGNGYFLTDTGMDWFGALRPGPRDPHRSPGVACCSPRT